MTEKTHRVSLPRLPFMARLLVVMLAIAGACLGLVTMHATTSHDAAHSHAGISGAHDHSDVAPNGAATASGSLQAGIDSGFLATCEGCALGTVAGATGAALLLLVSAVAFILGPRPAVFGPLIDRGRVLILAVAAIPRSLTPAPLALGISRT
ncbi:hypothetical protein GCM10010988_39160 [Cnuibacter physcomitrellae]|uniref:Uncharacterized protein n=1 Tax=Cnuibacter physcomitrellae TaxID=1619308 RepID=A0A1X9LT96_9MICO|nr:hypothetical protein [Cnuibacter physcomitrellae]ARJ07548.1 hypothetical protein B5808_19305 [Cnuibacter physcomitrellae]GGI42464.1 hypothetical protein GCM10010988_39160 [Cnuibacter physcomitrellae]